MLESGARPEDIANIYLISRKTARNLASAVNKFFKAIYPGIREFNKLEQYMNDECTSINKIIACIYSSNEGEEFVKCIRGEVKVIKREEAEYRRRFREIYDKYYEVYKEDPLLFEEAVSLLELIKQGKLEEACKMLEKLKGGEGK